MGEENVTVVICCAGMGTRLGIGTTKALLDINETPLILRQLCMLKNCDDVRVVVGYLAERVIDVINVLRKDVVYVFNYEYATTGVARSLFLGATVSRDYVLYIDGDIVTTEETFKKVLD